MKYMLLLFWSIWLLPSAPIAKSTSSLIDVVPLRKIRYPATIKQLECFYRQLQRLPFPVRSDLAFEILHIPGDYYERSALKLYPEKVLKWRARLFPRVPALPVVIPDIPFMGPHSHWYFFLRDILEFHFTKIYGWEQDFARKMAIPLAFYLQDPCYPSRRGYVWHVLIQKVMDDEFVSMWADRSELQGLLAWAVWQLFVTRDIRVYLQRARRVGNDKAAQTAIHTRARDIMERLMRDYFESVFGALQPRPRWVPIPWMASHDVPEPILWVRNGVPDMEFPVVQEAEAGPQIEG